MVEQLVVDGKQLPIKMSGNTRKKMPIIIDPDTGETVIEWLLRWVITNRAPFLASRNPDTFGEFLDEQEDNVHVIQPGNLGPDPTQEGG